MGREPRDDVERQIGALELRIGIEHDRHVDGVGDGAEIILDLRVLEREIGFQDGENAIGAELVVKARLRDGVCRRGRRNAGDHRNAAGRGLDRGAHDGGALLVIEIGEFAGRAERRHAMHAGGDEIVDQPGEHIGADLAIGIDRRNQIREHAVEVGHSIFHLSMILSENRQPLFGIML